MFGTKQDKDVLAAYCFFWIVSTVFTVSVVLIRDATSLNVFKLFAAIAYGLYGGISLEVFDTFRSNSGLQYPEWSHFAIGQAFHGIFGILLFFWTLFLYFFGERLLFARGPDKKLDASTGFRSRAFFYIVVLELMFVGAIIIATALSYSHVPLGYAGCRSARLKGTDLEHISDITAVNSKQMCTRVVTVQILAIMTAILATLQAMAYMPLIAYPRIVRYVLFLIFHKTAPSSRKTFSIREKEPEAYDLEQLMPQKLATESSHLHEILADDTIAGKIARHLHFVDITNLSRASRGVRHSIHGNRRKPTEKRVQLFCEASCVGGEKSECWACAGMICKSCQQLRSNIPVPRTETHATSCFAVCTTCYLLRAPALPPPKAALNRTDDLAVQHNDCWNKCSQRADITKSIALCKSCNLLPRNEDVSEVREKRDAEALRRAHGGRLWCAECQKSLKKGKRRWFICEKGQHECHWEGHQMC